MYSLQDDYSEGAHPSILQALQESNRKQEAGYGMDSHSQRAIAMLQEAVGDSSAAVHLLSGGTQTNLTALAAFLRPHQACIATESGHIAGHEAGSIEACGHKVITCPGKAGKLRPEDVEKVVKNFSNEHSVQPKLVYISNSTELGTVYSRQELTELSACCRQHDLLLFLDGARLAAALVCPEADLSLRTVAKYTDAFYFGGTKNGALLGEALVITREELKQDFRYHLKQRGAMLAKGRVLGIQFEELLKDDLYLQLARHARKAAQSCARGLKNAGFQFFISSPSNQIFPIFPLKTLQSLEKEFRFHRWQELEDGSWAVRLVFSWASPEGMAEEFVKAAAKK